MSTAAKSAPALRMRGLLVKEARQVMRDPSNLLVAVVLPLLLLFLMQCAVLTLIVGPIAMLK